MLFRSPSHVIDLSKNALVYDFCYLGKNFFPNVNKDLHSTEQHNRIIELNGLNVSNYNCSSSNR